MKHSDCNDRDGSALKTTGHAGYGIVGRIEKTGILYNQNISPEGLGNALGAQFSHFFHPRHDVMTPTITTFRHRLHPDSTFNKKSKGGHPSKNKSTTARSFSFCKQTPCAIEPNTQQTRPQREVLVSFSPRSSFVIHQLPPESCVREISSRLGKRPQNRVVGKRRVVYHCS